MLLGACGSDSSNRGTAGGGAVNGSGGAANGGAGAGASGGSAAGTVDGGGVTQGGNIQSLEGGRYHTCLSTRTGAVYCWGQGAYGALGNDGSYRGLPTRALVVGDAIDVWCGGRFTCARRQEKSLFCWGEDQAGQLGGPSTKACGDATIDSVCAPVPEAVAGVSDARGVALGSDHACALLSDGSVSCWGQNAQGQLGDPGLGTRMQPGTVAGVSGATQVAAGDQHTCALVGSPGKVLCWGQNANGQIGSGKVSASEPSAVEVTGISDAVEVAAGGEHTCARRAGGTVTCWGYNYFGQLGRDSKQPTRATAPADVVGIGDATQLALGRYHSCALHASGTISCWGYNSKGELGDGTSTDRQKPVDVLTIRDAAALAAGSWHTCAILRSGPVLCWGDDLGGQLGIDGVNKIPNPRPVAVQNLPSD